MLFEEFDIHLLFLTGKIDRQRSPDEMTPEFLEKKAVEFFGNSLRIPVEKAADFTFDT